MIPWCIKSPVVTSSYASMHGIRFEGGSSAHARKIHKTLWQPAIYDYCGHKRMVRTFRIYFPTPERAENYARAVLNRWLSIRMLQRQIVLSESEELHGYVHKPAELMGVKVGVYG